MTWMIIRLILSLAFIGVVLLYAARLAKKKGLGQGNGLIEVVARQRMGRTSTVNVVRIGDVVLVVGATEEQVTLLAEVDLDTIDPLEDEEYDEPARIGAAEPARTARTPALAARSGSGALAGSVLDRNGWGSFVSELRERTVRRS
jgi:flagellar protein FliO/FliZ